MWLLCTLMMTLSTPQAPNVVFITVDTLRADRLGCYGYPHPTTPNLDAFAQEALRYSDCVCEEPQTGPSLCSMLSSIPPRALGVIRNAVPLPDDILTAPQLFQNAGYYTACVTSNWNLRRELSGLDRGFERYEDDFGRRFFGLRQKHERDAKEVTDLALDCLEQRDPKRPFFFWFHYMDPHGPYDFHKDFHPRKTPLRSLSRKEQVRARYDSEVAYTDHHLGRLLKALPRENTFIVFSADHGESLFEHNYLGHTRRIDQTTIHIPLLIYGPSITPGCSTLPVSGLDFAPTLLSLAGLPVPPAMQGAPLTQSPPKADRVRIVETYGGKVPRGTDPIEGLQDRSPQFQGVIKESWKLLQEENKDSRLYDLSNDPGELTDRAQQAPDTVSVFQDELKRWNEKTPRRKSSGAQLREEDIRALEATGYL